MHLALVIEGAPFVRGATDLHLRRSSKGSRVFANASVRRSRTRVERRRVQESVDVSGANLCRGLSGLTV